MTDDLARDLLADMSARVPDDLVNFGRALDDADGGLLVDGWPYFLTTARKWAREYTIWTNLGKPQAGTAEWNAFVEQAWADA